MDKLEGYLQCFDLSDREITKQNITDSINRFGINVAVDSLLKTFVLMQAIRHGNTKTMHALIEMDVTKGVGPHFVTGGFGEIARLLYDRGIYLYNVIESDKPKLHQFLHSRSYARKAAIAVLSLFYDGRSAAVGRNRKDVGRIIGRVIWASRGIKEWTN